MPNQNPGIHLERGAGQRYAIHVPFRYTEGKPIPLILMLHWGGKKTKYIGLDVLEGLAFPALNTLQSIIVAPNKKRMSWETPKAEQDLLKLLSFLEDNYNIHPTHRAIAGFSIGGMGVWHMAETHPDKFSCGVVMAAPVPKHVPEKDWDFPLFIIHSELDELFPFDLVKKRTDKMLEKNAPIQLHALDVASHLDIRDYIPVFGRSASWIAQQWGLTEI